MSTTITLDIQSLKALAAEARLSILKYLQKRRHTVSELAKLLELSVPTVKEHLLHLVKADLVQKHDDGRKWKYYSLTKKGRAIVKPEEKKFILLFASMILSAVGAVYAMWDYLSLTVMQAGSKTRALAAEKFTDEAVMEPASYTLGRGSEQIASADANIMFVIFFLLLFFMLLWYYLRSKGFTLQKKNV